MFREHRDERRGKEHLALAAVLWRVDLVASRCALHLARDAQGSAQEVDVGYLDAGSLARSEAGERTEPHEGPEGNVG